MPTPIRPAPRTPHVRSVAKRLRHASSRSTATPPPHRVTLAFALAAAFALLAAAWAQPAPRLDPAMAYDAASDLVVLYGGESPQGAELGDTWVFDPATGAWDERAPDTSPPPLREHLLAYDAQSDRVVLWGGFGPDGENLDLWSYDTDADAWTRVEQTTSLPPGRRDSAAVYAPAVDRVVVMGGWDQATGPNLADTWLLDVDSGSWTEVTTDPSPSNRVQHTLAYDPASETVVLFGGLADEGGDGGAQGAYRPERVWILDLDARTWTERPPLDGPEELFNGALAALGDSGTLLFYGGGPFGDDQAWLYDVAAHSWTAIDAPDPGPLSRHAMVSLPDGAALLFGGQYGWRSDDVRTDVWRFDLEAQSWSQP